MVGLGNGGLVTLQLQVIVITEQVMEPLHHLLSLIDLTRSYQFGYLTAQAGRAAYNALMILLQVIFVCTRMRVEAIGPGTRYYLYKVMISLFILGKQDKMVVGSIQLLAFTLLFMTGRDIDLTTYDGLEMLTLFLKVLIDFIAVVLELLYAHHVAVISHCNAAHTIGYSLINQLLDVGLAVQQRVLRMNMKMNEFLHIFPALKKFLKLPLIIDLRNRYRK